MTTEQLEEGLAEKLDKAGGTVTGDLAIQGNLTVAGTTKSEKTKTLMVEDNVIVTNANKVALQALLSGLAINKDANATYGIMYDPADDTVKFGQGVLDKGGKFTFSEGEGKPLAIRAQSTELNEGHLIKWDSTTNSFVDSGKTVTDFVEVQPFSNPSAGTPYEDEVAYNAYAIDKDGNTEVIPISANRHSGNTLVLRFNDGRISASDAIDPHNVTTKVQVENRMNALSPDLRDEFKTYIYFKGTKFPTSDNSKFTLPVDMEIDWGDGKSQVVTNDAELLSHTYTDKTNIHIITISGLELNEIPNQWLMDCTGILSMYVGKKVYKVGDYAFLRTAIPGELVFNGGDVGDTVGLKVGVSALSNAVDGGTGKIVFEYKVGSIDNNGLAANGNSTIVINDNFVPTLGTGTTIGKVIVPKDKYLDFKASEQWKDLNIVYEVNSADIPKVNITKIQDSSANEFAPDENGVVTIPNGGANNLGLMKLVDGSGYHGLQMWGAEAISLDPAGKTFIDARDSGFGGAPTYNPKGNYKPIVSSAINYAVKAALTDDKRIGTETTDPTTFTDTEKDRACEILGAARTTALDNVVNELSNYEKSPNYVLIEKVITGYTVLETEPEDFTTNYASYYKTNGKARNDIDFAYVALTEAETFETGKYYSKTTEGTVLDRHGASGKEPDGTSYAFKNMYFYFENLQTEWAAYTHIHFYNGNSQFPYHFYLSRNNPGKMSDVYANIYGNMMTALSTKLNSEMHANSDISIMRATIKDNMVLSGFSVSKLPTDTTVLIYGVRI